MNNAIVKAALIVLFAILGLLIIVVIVGLITKELDPTGIALALSGIISGTLAGLIAKGGGDK